MNEFLRNFIMTGIKDMISKNVALYQTYQYASGWFSKGVLLQEDLEEIQRLYEEKAKEIVEEVPNEDITTDFPTGEIVTDEQMDEVTEVTDESMDEETTTEDVPEETETVEKIV